MFISIPKKLFCIFLIFIQISMNFGNLYRFLELFNRIKMERINWLLGQQLARSLQPHGPAACVALGPKPRLQPAGAARRVGTQRG
jgi:hypothetical protein